VKCWIVSHFHLHPYSFVLIDIDEYIVPGEEIQKNYRVKK
jgi:hypothetical protein